MDTVVFTDSAAMDFFANDVVLVKANAEVDSLLAQKYHVSGYPTFVLTDANGEEIDRIVGSDSTDSFIQTIRDYENGIGTLDDLLHRAETETDRALFFEIADKYKYRGGSEEAKTWYGRVIDEGEPTDSLSGESRFSIADMFRRAEEYDRAHEEFGSIMNDFKGTMFAQDAEIYKAIVYRRQADTAAAIKAFEDFIKHFPESEDVEYANKQIEKLKNPDVEGK
jgi:tetratricopeptide (TPR) repeat protein